MLLLLLLHVANFPGSFANVPNVAFAVVFVASVADAFAVAVAFAVAFLVDFGFGSRLGQNGKS